MQDGLYEDDLCVKVAAVERVSQLFYSTTNFGVICQHPSLLPGLARYACDHAASIRPVAGGIALIQAVLTHRVLREDGRRSAGLTTSILRAFLALSCFSQLHAQLAALRVGSLAMDALEAALHQRNGQPEVILTFAHSLRGGCGWCAGV